MLDIQTENPRSPGPSLHPLHPGSGRLITPRSGQRLLELDPQEILPRLATHGYLLFRDFPADVSVFSEFVQRYSSRMTLDPARVFHGGSVAQKVDAGEAAMGLHLENGNSPFRPDLTWFFCERAARRGSQTTVCDGQEVWKQLSPSAQRQFLEQDIVYRRRVEAPKWKLFVYHNRDGSIPMERITLEDLRALVNDQSSTALESHPDGSITYSFRTPAVLRSRLGSGRAWANSIFGPSYNYEAPRITFANGSALSAGLLEELRLCTEALTVNIDWQDGDLALIDNARVMHGRREIEDRERRIFNALSYLHPELT